MTAPKNLILDGSTLSIRGSGRYNHLSSAHLQGGMPQSSRDQQLKRTLTLGSVHWRWLLRRQSKIVLQESNASSSRAYCDQRDGSGIHRRKHEEASDTLHDPFSDHRPGREQASRSEGHTPLTSTVGELHASLKSSEVRWHRSIYLLKISS